MTNIGVCQLHILPCSSILCVCLGDCGLPLALFQVDFRVLVYPTSRQSRWCQEDDPGSHSFEGWVKSQEVLEHTLSVSVWHGDGLFALDMSSNLTHYTEYTTLLRMYPLHCFCCEV